MKSFDELLAKKRKKKSFDEILSERNGNASPENPNFSNIKAPTTFQNVSAPIKVPTSTSSKIMAPTFDDILMSKYSAMSLADIEKELSRIEDEEKKFKKDNGSKFINFLTKAGSYLSEGKSGISGQSVRDRSQSNIDKIDDYTRQKEIINKVRKQKATKEYLGGLNNDELKLLDNITKGAENEDYAPLYNFAAQFTGGSSTVNNMSQYSENQIGVESRKKLQEQLKKKNPDKQDNELNLMIDQMVELRQSQINEQRQAEKDAENQKIANENPISSFLLSRGANIYGGFTGLAELFVQSGNEYGYDTNAAGFELTNASKTIDEQIQLDHDWSIKVGDTEVDAFDFLYKAGTGIVDNVGRFLASGGNSTASGVTSFSQVATQGVINSKEKGYSDAKALTFGLLQGTFEALTEKLSLDLILDTSGGALKNLAKAFATEGSEELSSNWLNRIADTLANGKHSDLSQKYDEYINNGYSESKALAEVVGSVIGEDFESFLIGGIAGAVMGGGAKAVDTIVNKNGVELNETEQKVFDKLVEKSIADAEKDGKKLTKKEKKNLRNEVFQNLLKGNVSIDTIEEVLGGEDYTNYKTALDKETALKDEFDTLNRMKSGEMTGEQTDRRTELKQQLEAIKNGENNADSFKSKLSENVFNIAKDSRLQESYNEVERRKNAFMADVNKYTEKQRKTIQNAIDSGILNNTNRTHEFVDMIAKISADKGVLFDFTNNERLKESGFAIEGKTVNGYIQGENVTLNVNSAKALNSVVGHEITHVLEDTELYNVLKENITQYAKDIGEYDSRRKAIEELYSGMENADIDAELTADLVGDYLFTDEKFVRNLSVNNRNVFQKIYDEIKYLCKVATAGSKETRQLEKVKKTFEQIYKESTQAEKNTTEDSGVRYSLGQYSAKQINNWKNSKRIIIYKNNNQLLDFVNKSLNGEFLDKKMYFGMVSTELANEIYDKTNINVENYNVSISSYEVRKIQKDHGNEADENLRGQRAVTPDDYRYIIDTIQSPQVIKLSDNKYNNKPAIEFRSSKNDKVTVVAVVSDKHLDLFVQTAYIGKKNRNLATPTTEQADVNTPKTSSGTVSTINITDLNENVNTNNDAFFDAKKSAEHKEKQLLIIENTNPAPNSYNTWVRADSDIKTFEEALQDEECQDYDEFNPDYTRKMAETAVKTGQITVFSSYPIEQGVFVTPSRMEAESYSGTGKVYEKTVKLSDVAWIDVTQGQYANVNEYNFDKLNKKDYSLSQADSHSIKRGNYNVMGEEIAFSAPMQIQSNDKSNGNDRPLAPIGENVLKNESAKALAPIREDISKKNIAPLPEGFTLIEDTVDEANELKNTENNNSAEENRSIIGDVLPKGDFKRLISSLGKTLSLTKNEKEVISDIVQKYSTEDLPNNKKLFDEIKEKFSERSYTERNNEIADIKKLIKGYKFAVSEYIKRDITDYSYFKKRNYGKLNLSNGGIPVDTAYMELSSEFPEYFPEDIANPSDQLQKIAEVANMSNKQYVNETLDDGIINDATNQIVTEIQKMKKKSSTPEYKRSIQAQKKREGRFDWIKVLVGDTTHWKDKKMGLSYQTNTEKRNLRDIIRKSDGTRDIEKADEINDAFQGAYNHNEAILKRVSNQIKKKYADLKITRAEDPYIQMLGEFRYNPDTKLTQADIDEYYAKHKKKIDVEKVDKVIEMARKDYDELITQVNAVLRENGMKEIPYRKGYFPHFVEDKQSPLAKLLNWKTHKDDIPTDIAGLTEQFNPNRSWQSFNKQRQGDTTDYSFTKGFDTYLHGSLDWIYHIDDIQNRRALENYIRYTHSDKGIQDKINELNNGDVNYDADEYQKQVELIFKEARNPLNNFLIDFRTKTNTLANKKSTLDRDMETMLNREVYSISTNIFNRVTANQVVGSISSALTNFIPITQSWGQVSPVRSLHAMREVIKNAIHDDGTIDKSDFLTNRLKPEENLYKTNWDKVSNVFSLMMDVVDNFTSQVVWRSKYADNMHKGMSEVEAIKNADQFAENVIAGRSRGNMPTAFDSKNPLVKIFTAFQLEVNNQYGYMFKDMPQDMRNEKKTKLIQGYATMFIGATLYNALYSSITGRDAAFDPIKIIHELLKDIFDDDEEDPATKGKNIILNFTDDVLEEVPFIGGLLGGGRIPISSALPYGEGIKEAYDNTVTDFADGNWESLTKEWLNPLYYLVLPMGGGQLRKTVQGLKMFDEKNIVPGSYTDSGNLRFPVEDTVGNRIQAGIFGQYASKNARDYFDNERAPLKKEQIIEYDASEMTIQEYWKYRDDISKFNGQDDELAKKIDYIANMDLSVEKKNFLANNIVDRKEPIDLTNYSDFSSFEEFDYYQKNPEKQSMAKAVGGYTDYRYHLNRINSFKADKDKNGNSISGSKESKVLNYILETDLDYGEKIILYKSQYKSDDYYNTTIIDYLNEREDISYTEMKEILEELGFKVDSEGNVSW